MLFPFKKDYLYLMFPLSEEKSFTTFSFFSPYILVFKKLKASYFSRLLKISKSTYLPFVQRKKLKMFSHIKLNFTNFTSRHWIPFHTYLIMKISIKWQWIGKYCIGNIVNYYYEMMTQKVIFHGTISCSV
jgi:hypothetical protein